MADNTDRTVVVTGASSGIGLATVVELAQRGFDTIGTARSAAKAKAITDAATAAGVTVATRILDVTDADACQELLAGLDLYGLVNNAGYGLTGAVEDVGDDEARQLLETMVVAPMRLARLALPRMRANGSGRIVNISSIYGRTTTPLTGWYQGAKHAIEGLSDALRMEVARDGIAVVLVEPGGFKTNIWEDLQRDIEKRGDSRFGGAYERIGQLMSMSAPIMGEPAQCATVIANAVEARTPRARYLVGVDAQLLAATDRVTPTWVKDRVTRLLQGL